ncbi:MAG TPA: hypothetical protein VH720_10240 [Candidatus Limnocylindrales bacterium]
MTMPAAADAPVDQAHRPVFRWLLGVQVLATTVFGLVPLLVPGVFATVTGYTGDDQLVYRFAGAGTTGYFVAAILALAWRSSWHEVRLALVATLSFTALAAIGCAWSLLEGDRHWVVFVVLLAAAAFAVLAGYWLRADAGPVPGPAQPISDGWIAVIAVATLAAAVFGVAGLLPAASTAPLGGLEGTDGWIFRMAGAACFGYAPAGLLALRIRDYRRMRIQNLAGVTFNATAAAAAWLAVVSGEGGVVAPVVAVAATAFAIALALLDRRHAR